MTGAHWPLLAPPLHSSRSLSIAHIIGPQPISIMADVKQLSLQTQNLHSIPHYSEPHTAHPGSTPQTAAPRSSVSPKTKKSMSEGKDAASAKKPKTATTKIRETIPKGSTMTIPGMIGGEITYTPTTHRISKAKKGKKVHACEFPGCPKVCRRAWSRFSCETVHILTGC